MRRARSPSETGSHGEPKRQIDPMVEYEAALDDVYRLKHDAIVVDSRMERTTGLIQQVAEHITDDQHNVEAALKVFSENSVEDRKEVEHLRTLVVDLHNQVEFLMVEVRTLRAAHNLPQGYSLPEKIVPMSLSREMYERRILPKGPSPQSIARLAWAKSLVAKRRESGQQAVVLPTSSGHTTSESEKSKIIGLLSISGSGQQSGNNVASGSGFNNAVFKRRGPSLPMLNKSPIKSSGYSIPPKEPKTEDPQERRNEQEKKAVRHVKQGQVIGDIDQPPISIDQFVERAIRELYSHYSRDRPSWIRRPDEGVHRLPPPFGAAVREVRAVRSRSRSRSGTPTQRPPIHRTPPQFRGRSPTPRSRSPTPAANIFNQARSGNRSPSPRQ